MVGHGKIEPAVTVAFIWHQDTPILETMRRETYCTRCKENVSLVDAKYFRLANARAVIKGKCPACGLELIKSTVMPKSSALKLKKKRGKKSKKDFYSLI
jgi:hypothetical protein